MFTINNPVMKDINTLLDLGHSDRITYLVYGLEHDDGVEGHTPHLQGFVMFKQPTRSSAVSGILGGRAWVGFPKKEDPSARCANYCKKEGFYFEYGALPGSPSIHNADPDDDLSTKALKAAAVAWLSDPANTYKRFKDLDGKLLMTPGFLQAYTARRRVLLGPDRPDIRTITIIGPTACGKSFAAHNLLPDHAKCFYGNSGAWFANGDAPVLLFEEFNGQIPIQKMLTLLDHYPFQLEEKGGFCPALYTTVVITSNVTPDHWYSNFIKQGKMAEDAMRLGISLDDAERKYNEAKKALFDRLGFRTNKRGCGHYMEWTHSFPEDNPAHHLECLQMRDSIWDWLAAIVDPSKVGYRIIHPRPRSPPPAADAAAAVEHESLPDQTQELDSLIEDDEEVSSQPPHCLRRMDAMSPDEFGEWFMQQPGPEGPQGPL